MRKHRWSRLNPVNIERTQHMTTLRLLRDACDADRAIKTNNEYRRDHSLLEMMFDVALYEQFRQQQSEAERKLADFKHSILAGEIHLPLHLVTEKMFFSSEEEESFWRVCYELNEIASQNVNQNKEVS